MQIFVKTAQGRTLVLDVETQTKIEDVCEMLSTNDKVQPTAYRFLYAGRQLEGGWSLGTCGIQDGATIYCALRLRGGSGKGELSAAAKKKKERKHHSELQAMEALKRKWFRLADRSKDEESMRLLCVSNVLEKHVPKTMREKEALYPEGYFAPFEPDVDDPQCDTHDPDKTKQYYGKISGQDEDSKEASLDDMTGFKRQADYNECFRFVLADFAKVYGKMQWSQDAQTYPSPEIKEGIFNFTYTATKEETEEAKRQPEMKNGKEKEIPTKVTLTCKPEGLWYGGPVMIEICDKVSDKDDKKEKNVLWELKKSWEKAKKEKKLQGFTANPLQPPWAKSPECVGAELERWIYEGIGTTTFFINPDQKVALWSQEDTDGVLALTDGERRMLTERCQLYLKLHRKDVFSPDFEQSKDEQSKEYDEEKKMAEKSRLCIEKGPCHNPSIGILQWRVRSLKARLFDKCVFWTNPVKTVPGGSVADGTKTKLDSDGEKTDGEGNEVLEFYKYKKKIGILRRTHVMEDRQRLLDQIEQFTPEYKAVIKNKGAEADDEGGSDHYMVDAYVQKICNIVALAMDMHIPDYDEDRIACFVKTLLEKHVGPTWHVLVGRSFGFVIQCEARHFVHLYMRHLAFVIWKSEPDIKKAHTRSGQAKS